LSIFDANTKIGPAAISVMG